MKRIFLILVALVVLSGCTDIKQKDYNSIIVNSLNRQYKYVNIYREGYNYYIPKGLKISLNTETSDIITDNKYNYYLYIDRISYYNKVPNSYQINKNAFFSDMYNYGDKNGYLEITALQDNKYLIEIMYNYAKIEVIVDKDDINQSLGYGMSILSSVKYNNKIIANLVSSGKTEFKEEEYNIFSTVDNDSNVLKYKETYTEIENDNIPDTDLID